MTTSEPPAPPVLPWYRAYCAAMALLYLACVVGGALLLVFHERIAALDRTMSSSVGFLVYGVVLAVIGFVLMAAFAAALVLPRKPWVWVYHIVLISIGLSSPCCMLASVPLLIFWIKPETRAYFGRSA